MSPIKSGEELLNYIPQRSPFVLVSDLYKYEDKEVLSGFAIDSDHVLVADNMLQETGLVENMAQTAALFAGFGAQEQGKPAPVGYIASIKDLNIYRLPMVGDKITTSVKIVNEVMNVQIAEAKVLDGDERVMASCEMRIFINE